MHPYFDNYLNPLSLIPELGLDRVLLTPSGGASRGVELSARDQIGESWTVSGSYTRSHVTDDFPGGRDVHGQEHGYEQQAEVSHAG